MPDSHHSISHGGGDDDDHDAMSTLRATLDEIGWLSLSDERGNNIFVDLDTDDLPVAYAHAAISPELMQFVLYLVLKLEPANDRRTECALVITHINSKLLVGGFDLDLDTGRLS